MSLAEARSIAAENKALAVKGINPKYERQKPIHIPTFSEVADAVIEIKSAALSNAKHKAQWRSTLETYAYPFIGSTPVNEITVNHIHELLRPIWKDKTETASRVRGRIQAVLDYAIVKKMMESPNPAVWTGNLAALLPSKTSANRKNLPALQLKDAQRWWEELKQRDGIGTLALMMLTLTASRSGEIRGMQWDEISLFDEPKAIERGYLGIWTRPAERMKAKREHRVPIIQPMCDLSLIHI